MIFAKALIRRAVQALTRGDDQATRIAIACGHSTSRYGTIAAFNDQAIIQLPTNKVGVPLYCAACVTKMSCQCAACGRSIFVADPVRIFVSCGGDTYQHAEVFSQHPQRMVGCMRGDCAPLEGHHSGIWTAGEDGNAFVGELSNSKVSYKEAMKSRRRILYVG